jgi:hypothetical protein
VILRSKNEILTLTLSQNNENTISLKLLKAITILTKIKKSYLKILPQAFSRKIKDSSLNVGNTPSTAQKHSQVLEKYLITEYGITDIT